MELLLSVNKLVENTGLKSLVDDQFKDGGLEW